MHPTGTQKTTLPVTQWAPLPENQRATTLVTPRATLYITPKTPVNSRSSTPRDIKRKSPGIYCIFYLLRSSNSVTIESLTAEKRLSQISEKYLSQINTMSQISERFIIQINRLKYLLLIKYAHNTYDRRTQKIPSEDTVVLLPEEKANSCQSDSKCWRVPCACTYILIDDRVTSMRNTFDHGNAMLGKITFFENLPLFTTDD